MVEDGEIYMYFQTCTVQFLNNKHSQSHPTRKKEQGKSGYKISSHQRSTNTKMQELWQCQVHDVHLVWNKHGKTHTDKTLPQNFKINLLILNMCKTYT